MFVYVGTYTNPPGGNASGIEVMDFDPDLGTLTPVTTVMGVANPSFLCLDAGNHMLYAGERFLYTVNEVKEGLVTAYRRDPASGNLTLLNSQSSHGVDPCYVSVDGTGRYVLVANYTSGSIAALPIAEDGSLHPASSVIQHKGSSVVAGRQEGPHAHMIASSPDDRLILVTDLGMDAVVIYQMDETSSQLAEHSRLNLAPGAGPRHFAFSPDDRMLYVLNELDSTVSTFDYDPAALTITPRQTISTLPGGGHPGNSTAQVVVSGDGKFVYCSNRGHDSIAIFAVDQCGQIAAAGHQPTGGNEPRNFNIDPSGRWLLAANQKSDTIVVFRRDQQTGALSQHGDPIAVPTPVCIVFADQ